MQLTSKKQALDLQGQEVTQQSGQYVVSGPEKWCSWGYTKI